MIVFHYRFYCHFTVVALEDLNDLIKGLFQRTQSFLLFSVGSFRSFTHTIHQGRFEVQCFSCWAIMITMVIHLLFPVMLLVPCPHLQWHTHLMKHLKDMLHLCIRTFSAHFNHTMITMILVIFILEIFIVMYNYFSDRRLSHASKLMKFVSNSVTKDTKL